jgi:hypothetical protein
MTWQRKSRRDVIARRHYRNQTAGNDGVQALSYGSALSSMSVTHSHLPLFPYFRLNKGNKGKNCVRRPLLLRELSTNKGNMLCMNGLKPPVTVSVIGRNERRSPRRRQSQIQRNAPLSVQNVIEPSFSNEHHECDSKPRYSPELFFFFR